MTQKRKTTARAPWFSIVGQRGLSRRGLPLKRKFRPRCYAKTGAGAPCIMRVVTLPTFRVAGRTIRLVLSPRSYEETVEPKQQLSQGSQSLYHCVCLQLTGKWFP